MTRIMLAMALLVPLVATAEVYRWKDENGNWQFGDRAPDSGHETLDLKPAAKIGQGDSVHDIHQRTLRLRESEQADKAEQQARQAQQQKAVAEACKKAKDRLRRLNRPFVYVDEDGTRRDASADQVRADIAKTQKWIDENCES
ncbi:MAG: DUF4124 domain-containing protein [Alcanivorax sediminis]|uniref:DUF4124 domain-containing protein n=1 Tax=Alcanivorax sediminis TaxID=2663008 RepID=UPI003C4CC3E2